MSESEIIQNASFGNPVYDYDPQQRMNQIQIQQPQQMYCNPAYMQPQYNYQFNNYMNQPQSGFQGYAGNPAFQYIQTNGYGMQQNPYMVEDYNYTIPGFNTGSRELMPADVEETCNQLQTQMMMELEEANIARIEKQKSYYTSMGFNGSNYYGSPYMNTYYADPMIVNKYKQKIEAIKKEAREARTNLNKNLSRLCQNYLNGEIDEERIEEIYSDHLVTVPARDVQFEQKMQMLHSLVPVDTSAKYREHNARVSAEYSKYLTEGSDMNTFLRECGELISAQRLEEEDHNRRDVNVYYQQDGAYKSFIRQKIKERHNAEQGGGITLPNMGQLNSGQLNNGQSNIGQLNTGENIPFGNAFPTLNESAKLLDDGTLQISAPAWLGNKDYVVKNTMEDDYEKNRQLFIQSIYRDNPRPGGDNDGS
jgi:hypothetical protein